MKCAHCKANHASITEVKNCSAGTAHECRHELPTGTCVCGWDRGIRGKGSPARVRANYHGWCWLGGDEIEPRDLVVNHWSTRGWVHYQCWTERTWLQPPGTIAELLMEPYEDYPPYERCVHDHLTWLLDEEGLADLPSLLAEERTSTVPMLRQIEEDMGEPIDWSLLGETFDYESYEWVDVDLVEDRVGRERAGALLGPEFLRFLSDTEKGDQDART